MTPVLLLVFGFAPAAAIGTDLWFAAITKLFATRVHHARGLWIGRSFGGFGMGVCRRRR
jgi:uncharacterized membrane protein YfcA